MMIPCEECLKYPICINKVEIRCDLLLNHIEKTNIYPKSKLPNTLTIRYDRILSSRLNVAHSSSTRWYPECCP